MQSIIKKYVKFLLAMVGGALIDRIINWMIDAAPQAGNSILHTIVNLIYINAATQTSSSVILIFFSGVIGSMVISYLLSIKESFSFCSLASNVEKKIKNLSEEDQQKIFSYHEEEDEVYTPPHDEKAAIQKAISDAKSIRVSCLTSTIVIILSVLWLLLFIIYPSILWSKFNLDITEIHPYIEDHAVLELKSDWVQMKGKDDYIQIYEVIDSVKHEFDLK